MLILGKKYKFTKFEKVRLIKQGHKLHTIRYNETNPKDVLEEIKRLISKNHKITTIVLNTKISIDDKIIQYLTKLQFDNTIKIVTIERFVEDYLFKCYIPENNIELNYLDNIKEFTVCQYIQKRIIDYIGVFTLLFLTWPILIITRYKIKKQSPGTSMFKQDRVGLKGTIFKCIKFRSMILNAEKDGAKFASKNDERVFSWGETIRKTRIDEIPQIINILKGDMHFIGPRPERKVWIDKFEKEIPYYHERHIIRPGITGWAQVMYPYGANIEDTRQKLMYDLYYIKHWSILLELKVVFKTIMVVLSKKGV